MTDDTSYEQIRFSPIKLPYRYNDLEPYIDEETMLIHYNKHYLTYLKNFNKELDKYDIYDDVLKIMEDIHKYPIEVRDNGGGFVNHSMFWKTLRPNKEGKPNRPTDVAKNLILQHYGTYGQFKGLIQEAGRKRFGSGWIWWVMNRDGSTNILATPYQDNPYMSDYNCYPLFGIDVWEHAYYLKYDADRAKYIDNIFNILNWEEINRRCIIGNSSIRDIKIVV